jgi:hypothetical protein
MAGALRGHGRYCTFSQFWSSLAVQIHGTLQNTIINNAIFLVLMLEEDKEPQEYRIVHA